MALRLVSTAAKPGLEPATTSSAPRPSGEERGESIRLGGAEASEPSELVGHQAAELSLALLALARAGDPKGLEAFVRLYQGRVFHLCRRLLCDDEDAEDAAQEALVKGARALVSFEPHGPARLSTWLLTIATRVALDERRRRRRRAHHRARFAGQDHNEAVSGETVDQHQALAQRELQQRLEVSLAELPEPQRLVFVWRVLLERSVEETATALNVDVGTVKSRLSRARSTLRPLLGGTQ